MDEALKELFLSLWARYFPGADLPLAIFYSDGEGYRQYVVPGEGFSCMIGQLTWAKRGKTVAFTAETIGCLGGVKYAGFPTDPNPNLKYFLSCGLPGEVEGLRLKRSPELVEEAEGTMPLPAAAGKYLVCKRLDQVEPDETPVVVAWFAPPDVVSALFNLAAFGTSDRMCVISPQSSGCGSILSYPLAEGQRRSPRAVLGMFDISARPFVRSDSLTFAVPRTLFAAMVGSMEDSFLATPSWDRVRRRLGEGS